LILAVTLLSLPWLPLPAAAAQSEPTAQPSVTPEPGPLIYIVQPGDTLYAIATQFGVPVELLATANNIDDPNQLSIGQRLLIPPQSSIPAGVTTHAARPGETLHSLGLSYQVQELRIAEANHLVREDQLIIGQELAIPGRTDPAGSLFGRAYALAENETLVGVAVEHGLSPWALAETNLLRSPLYAPPGTRLWIPEAGDQAAGEYLDWPPPFSGIAIHPLPARQGETLSIRISLTAPYSVTGNFLGRPLAFFSDGGDQVALTGIEAMTEEMAPMLTITATSSAGEAVHYAQRLLVASGDYGSETVTVSAETAAQMTAEAVTGEDQFLSGVFSARTPARQWDGLFSLPAAGDITSSFGTRRSYNIPNGSPYHTGTDFGRTVGTPVYAPAGGTVVFTGTLTVRGNVVVLDHGWGVMTGYWHLSAIHVEVGDVVVPGQHIGDIGSSGLSTGPHLHWELRVNGVPVSGLQWVREEFP
jgi:murein DD-endopeptidase MepM/ murein hydrolase activator NlpD